MTSSDGLIDDVLRTLAGLPKPPRYWVAYSGGPDSRALLEILCQAGRRIAPLGAVHVNHRLHPNADGWARHCAIVCEGLGVGLKTVTVDLSTTRTNIEAVARERRYAVFADLLEPGEMLLTAHTAEDQAETLLLQLLRGAGAHGLAAMPVLKALGAGWHARVLLEATRGSLPTFDEGRAVIEDPANRDLRVDRSYLRREVYPAIVARWPAATRTLGRAAHHQSDVVEILAEIGREDLGRCRAADRGMDCELLLQLSAARRRNAVREWVRGAGLSQLSERQLRALEEVLRARAGAGAVLAWRAGSLRRYREHLYLVRRTPAIPVGLKVGWRPGEAITLPHGQLCATPMTGAGLDAETATRRVVTVRLRVGGERCHPSGRRHSQTLKKLLQATGVAPWLRARLPLIYVDEELAAVAGLWVCEAFVARAGQPGWAVSWRDACLE